MPTRLKSRRTLLKDTALASAAFVMGGCELEHAYHRGSKPEPPAERDAVCWALVTDPHIDPAADAMERGQNMYDNFRAVVQDALRRHQKISGMIIVGDVAHREGDPRAYMLALELVEPIRRAGIPLSVALGRRHVACRLTAYHVRQVMKRRDGHSGLF